jgi:hypothetical protein
MYVSTALRNINVRSTRLFLLPTIDSGIAKASPIEPVMRYRWPETLGHRLLRKRSVKSSKPLSSKYPASNHQVDEYV